MVKLFELRESRVITATGSRAAWMAVDADGESDAKAAAAAVAPATLYGYYPEPDGWEVEGLGGRVYKVTRGYGSRASDPAAEVGDVTDTPVSSDPANADPNTGLVPGDGGIPAGPDSETPPTWPGADPTPSEPDETAPIGPEYSFSTLGGTVKARHALTDAAQGGTASRYWRYVSDEVMEDVPESGFDYGDLVGAKLDGDKLEPEGVDIPDPKLEFNTTRTVAAISLRYWNLLSRLSGCVNDRKFMGFPAGSLMFLGADGQGKPQTGGATQWSVTFHFVVSPNIIAPKGGWKVAGKLFLPEGQVKEGWDYLEVYYRDMTTPEVTANGGRNIAVPFQFSIKRLHRRANFRLLGL